MTPRPNRTILANFNSDTMAANPTARYLRAMALPTPRMLWEAEPGDCVVTLAPCGDRFREYVSRTVGLDVDRVGVVAPAEIATGHVLDVADALGALDALVAPGLVEPFALDGRVVDFARGTGVGLLPYASHPSDATLREVRRINTKSGIRETAVELGLPVADGGWAADRQRLVTAVTAFLADRPAAIVKSDRSSTGFGNVVVAAGARAGRERRVRAALADEPDQDCGWVYEEFLPLTASPSLELIADETGVTEYYSCDQRTVNNAWTGMVTPAADGPHTAGLRAAALAVGERLRAAGYRGILDVDFGTHDGGYVITEANVRTTGGTYLQRLARRLRPGPGPLHWRADGRLCTGDLDFPRAVDRLAAAGLADPSGDVRAVITSDTRHLDGKWRYLVAGGTAETVAEAERVVEEALGI